MMKIRTYSELITFETFEDRLEYLKLSAGVGIETFGFDRYLNQMFYTSREWRHARNEVIVRDRALDLGIEGRDILESIRVHHMNPIRVEDLEESNDELFNPEFLISTSLLTHNAIHYGRDVTSPPVVIERYKSDTLLW